MADVTYYLHTTLAEVPVEDLEDDGFDDAEEALSCLREWYPDIALDSPVTVIRWNNLRGRLADEARG